MGARRAIANLRLSASRLIGELRSPGSAIATWIRGAGWVLSASLVERAAALVQTIAIARAIGIDDYGRYALLFSTIGLLTPIVSLQLPYAIIVHLSRLRDRREAGAVLLLAEMLTTATLALFVLVALAAPGRLSTWLFAADGYRLAVLLGAGLLLLTVKAGVYDAILQASDRFRTLSLARSISALATLALVGAAAAMHQGLDGMLAALLLGSLIRTAAVAIPAWPIGRALKQGLGLRRAWHQLPILLRFSLPSGLLSLGLGYSAWIGNYYLARQSAALRDLAVLNTAVQWRSPILMVTTALATALLPALGRALAQDDATGAARLMKYNLVVSLALAIGLCLAAGLLAGPLLSLYGPSFADRRAIFLLFLLPLIFTVYCTAHQQYLVADGRLWTQFAVYIPLFAIQIGGTFWFGADLDGGTLALVQLAGWAATALLIGFAAPRPKAVR